MTILPSRPLFAVAGFVLLAAPSTAFAQVGAIPPQTSSRHAGTYHVETGTWSRTGPTADLGADVVYNNTCDGGSFYYTLDGRTVIDEGRLPSPTSPTSAVSRSGCASAYTIDGFDILYCTDLVGGTTLTYDFHQSYFLCSSLIGVPPTASVSFPGPGAPAGGFVCWSMSVDLGAQSFTMLADGDGVYTLGSDNNLFGVGVSTNPSSARTGPGTAGSTDLCGFYDGTRWDNGPAAPFWPNNQGEISTGMGTLDMHRFEGGIPTLRAAPTRRSSSGACTCACTPTRARARPGRPSAPATAAARRARARTSRRPAIRKAVATPPAAARSCAPPVARASRTTRSCCSDRRCRRTRRRSSSRAR